VLAQQMAEGARYDRWEHARPHRQVAQVEAEVGADQFRHPQADRAEPQVSTNAGTTPTNSSLEKYSSR